MRNNQLITLLCSLNNIPEDFFNNWWCGIIHFTKEFIKITLIFERQPPSIIKKGKNFGAKIRWLIGSKLDCNMIRGLTGTATIVNEAWLTNEGENRSSEASVTSIFNGVARFEYHRNSEVSATLYSSKLMSISRKMTKRLEKITDEKYALKFSTKITWNNEELDIAVISLPICLTTHQVQDELSTGKIMWDYAFAAKDRQAFQVPDTVQWSQLADALSGLWNSRIGCTLTKDHIKYLYDRVFVEDPSCTEIPMRLISWNNITKDNMPGMNFTFWNWFYKAMKLVKDTYKEAWMSGHILGFIHREKAKGLLEGSRPFTFLFRFSESIEGKFRNLQEVG
ncbi:signal transducer and transcription activator-like [Phlebotomus papatasi]|uniref:signal transducer and transcription activator-like n=1 Tax=Phlebotomus papatasi TaxID=29031 RepID=UPI0024833E76|nr:signal transducer and transcription activator-like [Phlebotomus papatasi]